MSIDWDVFFADFGNDFLEFELRLTELEYEDGKAIVSWELEKMNDQLGGISYVVLVMSPREAVEYHEPDPRSRDSQTMRVDAEPGDTIDVTVYDTLNTDYEPGDGFVGPGQAQVSGEITDDVFAGGEIEIVSCDTSGRVAVGETVYVGVEIENVGDEEGRATVVTTVGGAESTSNVTLAPGEQSTVVSGFEFDDTGEFPASVELR